MKLLSIVMLSLMSILPIITMDRPAVVEQKEDQEVEMLLTAFAYLDIDHCSWKKNEMHKRRQRYEENGVVQSFDKADFAKLEAKLSGTLVSPVSLGALMKGNAINKPDSQGVFPLQHALKAGRFDLALQMLDGNYEENAGLPAQVKLNFVQKEKNPFVMTLITSLRKSILTYAHAHCATSEECLGDKQLEKYLQMKGALLLNKLLQRGASTDFHGTKYGNNQVRNLEKFADEKKLSDMAELIRLARERNYSAMNDLVLMIQDEMMRSCQAEAQK